MTKTKEREKVIHNWEDEGIKIEKGRWGKFYLIKSKKKILSMVKGASTVVIVSHSFGLMTDVCDRVVLLDHGKIVTQGDPQDSIKAYYDLEG